MSPTQILGLIRYYGRLVGAMLTMNGDGQGLPEAFSGVLSTANV